MYCIYPYVCLCLDMYVRYTHVYRMYHLYTVVMNYRSVKPSE